MRTTSSFGLVLGISALSAHVACSGSRGDGEGASDGIGGFDSGVAAGASPPGDGDGDGDVGDGDSDMSGNGGTWWNSSGGVGCENLSICGPDGEQDCCERLEIPGGTFAMGRGALADACPGGATCSPAESPEHDVTVSAFHLDRFEVTVGRFRAFVEAFDGWQPALGNGAHPLIPGSGYSEELAADLPESRAALLEDLACDSAATYSMAAESNEAKPVNCVNHSVAFAFCMWDGGRLPTEAEWEFAAAGGSENRLYPWGSAEPDEERASYFPSSLGVVGTHGKGKGAFGNDDLAGNAWEWVLDWLDTGWYSGGGSTCVDCARVSSGSYRVLRGGAYSYEAVALRSATRSGELPGARDRAIGFRCAYDVAP